MAVKFAIGTEFDLSTLKPKESSFGGELTGIIDVGMSLDMALPAGVNSPGSAINIQARSFWLEVQWRTGDAEDILPVEMLMMESRSLRAQLLIFDGGSPQPENLIAIWDFGRVMTMNVSNDWGDSPTQRVVFACSHIQCRNVKDQRPTLGTEPVLIPGIPEPVH